MALSTAGGSSWQILSVKALFNLPTHLRIPIRPQLSDSFNQYFYATKGVHSQQMDLPRIQGYRG